MPACTREGFAIQEAMIASRWSSQGEGSETDQIFLSPRIPQCDGKGELVDALGVKMLSRKSDSIDGRI
jgi:hypothetical protein